MPADTREALEHGVAQGQLICVAAARLLHGCVRVADEAGGWKRPWRFSSDQVRTMGSCLAWHPGLFRQMARCTAGITLEFDTDSTEIALEVLLDEEPSGTRVVLDPIREGADDPLDGISATVDGRHLACVMPSTREAIVRFELDDPSQAPLPGLVMLPGFGDTHHVRVWLPALRGCAVRNVWGNGTYITEAPSRDQLLVIGDSIAQGFVTGDPALAWPSQLSERLGFDLVNQGLGGQVFQPGTLFGLASLVNPSVVVVALGENYRYEPCRNRPTARDIRTYLMEVTRLWPEVPTYVCTPLWHDEQAWPSHKMSCWERVPSMIEANVAVHDQMVPVDGMRLIDHDPSVLADGYEHPTAEGAAQVANRLAVIMQGAADRDETALRADALRMLEHAPACTLPLAEALRRGIGTTLYAQDGCVLLDIGNDQAFIWASDLDLGHAVASMLTDALTVGILEPALTDGLERSLDLHVREPFHTAVYRRKAHLRVAKTKDIRVLDESYADTVLEHYSHPQYVNPDLLLAALGRGDFLGAFESDELVGFIGEHPEGAIGLLEVFEGYQGKGWGRALEASKINQSLDRGQTPWLEVFAGNEASLALQRKLGLTVSSADEQLFLCKHE